MKYGDKCRLKITVDFPEQEGKEFFRVPAGTIATYLSKVKEIDGVHMARVHLDKEERVELIAEALLEPTEEKLTAKPAHYDTGIDTIAFLRANCPPEQVEGFLRGNAIKYLQRYASKGTPVEDLKKSRHYIDMLIEEVEGRV